MYTVRVKSELDDRLDAEFYNPVALETVIKLEKTGTTQSLGNLIEDGYRVVYHGTDSINGIDDSELLPFLSPTQIDDQGSIDFSSTDKLPLYYKEKYPRGLAITGELLVEVKGNVSKVGIIPDSFPENLMISGSLYKASLKKSVDSSYLLAFLKSKHGQILKNRLTSNTIINYIAKDALYSITILLPNSVTQKYIGDKVRQAERLRGLAKQLEGEFTQALKEAVGEAFEDKHSDRKHTIAKSDEITYTLNPGAFDEERIRVQRYLKSVGGKSIKEVAIIQGQNTTDISNDTVYIGLDAIASNSCQLTPSSIGEAGVIGACRYLPEGTVMAKLRPYLNKVSYIPTHLSGAVGSTELLCLSPKGALSGWYLYGVLKSELTLKQIRPVATGATHPRIDQDDIYYSIIPILDNHQELGDKLKKAQEAYFSAKELISAAKLLVEGLIEGLVTEDELIAAQRGLDAGDTEADAAILRRLKTDGLDGEGQALFGDVERVYELLKV